MRSVYRWILSIGGEKESERERRTESYLLATAHRQHLQDGRRIKLLGIIFPLALPACHITTGKDDLSDVYKDLWTGWLCFVRLRFAFNSCYTNKLIIWERYLSRQWVGRLRMYRLPIPFSLLI